MSKPDVYFHEKGLFIAPHLWKDYLIKVPTIANRLHRSGSAGVSISEKYDLDYHKKGIIYIDHTAKVYVVLPKEILTNPVGKNCQGLKNSIFSYNVNELIRQHNLELVPVLHEDEIRKRFGL